jgi:cytochrome c-type biogenesis protein CcmH/NrfG
LAVLAVVAASIGRQYAASRYRAAGAAKVATDPVAAIHSLQTAEQLDPYSLQTLYDIASAYAALDDYAGARVALVAAERREPHNYVPPALLGDLATRRGYYRIALAAYSRAQSLDPRDSEVQSLVRTARAQLTASQSTR